MRVKSAIGFLVVWGVLWSGWSFAQPPRKEEEEEPNPKAKVDPKPKVNPKNPIEPKKVDPAPAAPGAPEPVEIAVGTFKEEAARAVPIPAKDLFRLFSVPYDKMTATFAGGNMFYIVPVPFRELPEEEFEVQVLDRSLLNITPRKLSTGSGFTLTPFEVMILEQTEAFLNRKLTTIDRTEQLDYACRAIACGLKFHADMAAKEKRVGKGWDAVVTAMKTRLLRLQRDQFNSYVDAGRFDKADELGLKLFARNPDNIEIQKDVNGLQLLRVTKELRKPTTEELLRVREALLQYDRLPGNKNNSLIDGARKRLRTRAEELVAEAKLFDARKDTASALARLREAETIDPDLPAIAEARVTLRGRVLYVGVPSLPVRMSPATATSDPERWAVDLLFESLVQAVPDQEMTRFRPGLAEGLPGVVPLGRSFVLPRNISWSKDGTDPLDARDVRGTLALMKRPGYRERLASDGLDVFREIDRVEDPFRLRLTYEYGVMEPLGRATFKIIPARMLQEAGKQADDDPFARRPYGSGPFQFAGIEKEGTDRQAAVFRANPHYGRRNGKFGLPAIREIRFVTINPSHLVNDVAAGQLHLIPDCPADFAARLTGDDTIQNLMRVAPSGTNRRIHVLGINHRRSELQHEKLRQGLSAAIDREAVLTGAYRSPGSKAHSALTGPFPVGSWATPERARSIVLYRQGAGGLMAEALGNNSVRLKLLHLNDPKTQQVAQMIKEQIEKESTVGGRTHVAVDLDPVDHERFRVQLHLEHGFDLVLTHFDYRDDLYSLAGLLDPSAGGRHGRNYGGYLTDGTNPTDADRRFQKLIEESARHRDFNGRLKEKTWDLHAAFNQRVPFIPLWQLDRFVAAHRDLEILFEPGLGSLPPDRVDPNQAFLGVEFWRLR